MVDFSDSGIYSKKFDKEEQEFFRGLFDKLRAEFNIVATDELIGLERVIKNYIKLQRAEALVVKQGEAITIKAPEGERIIPHPLLNWISVWESQLRAWMKECRFTRKEKKEPKTKIQDLAKELSLEYEKIKNKKP